MCQAQLERFPDGESFVKIKENIRGHGVFIVQPTCPPTNDNLMELLIMIDACMRASASRITAVIPYYGYARQDRKDQPRVPITAKLVANLLVAAGTNRLLTLDLHSEQIQGFFDIPVDHLYSYPVVVKYLRKKKIEDLVMVSPDQGSLKNAYNYTNHMNAGLAFCAKNRKSATEVEVLSLVGDVDGKNCVLIDDMTSTGGTLCSAAEALKANGAKSIIAYVTHSLLNEKGYNNLKNSPITEFITTDSVPSQKFESSPDLKMTVLTVADILGEAISRIHNDQSVTSLFRV